MPFRAFPPASLDADFVQFAPSDPKGFLHLGGEGVLIFGSDSQGEGVPKFYRDSEGGMHFFTGFFPKSTTPHP